MWKRPTIIISTVSALCATVALGFAALAQNGPSIPPKSGAAKVDYDKQVKPLLVARCYACHGNGVKLGGLALDTYADLLRGGQSGPAVAVHDSANSLLIKLVSGADPKRIMPARGKRLTATEIATLKAWIDQGASYGKATAAASAWRAPMAPRRPILPAPRPGYGLTDLSNPIDKLLQSYFRANKIAPQPVVEDRVFARRVYLDLIGLLPTPDELRAFVADRSPDKRTRLVRKLLADNKNYTEHWVTFWNDMLRNDYAGTGYIDGGRTQITNWLYSALASNKPYDRFVAELVNPTPESAGFTNGIVWRGVVNASQTPPMQAAQNISQVFMGVNMKCASCHDSFISTWKLADAYGMAGIYADGPLEMVRCDKPTGKTAPIKFLYAGLGDIDGSAPRAQRLQQLANVLTSKQNGRLTRTIVNRLWTKLMGRGLVEPNDEMDSRPWNPDLLDWLAWDLSNNGYDLKKTIERIVTSRAYQLPVMSLASERAEPFVFRGPAVKRMTAEQFTDSVSQLTGVWQRPANVLRIDKGKPRLPATAQPEIKFSSGLMKSGAVDIDVDVTGAKALSLVATDGGNGNSFDWADWVEPRLVGPKGEIKLTDLPFAYSTTGYGAIQKNKSVVEKPLRLGAETFAEGIGAHANSIITFFLPEGVTRFHAKAGPDTGATEQPKSETSVELYVITSDRSLVEGRSSMALADPLMRALGRPNREQVVTQRNPAATTLQALEVTNGGTLTATLQAGAARWIAEPGTDLIGRLYEAALGRQPTPNERAAASQLVGSPARKEGVEDLLWALVMLPEYQLVY